MNFTKTHTKDMLWHGGKALLCALQLFLLDRVTALGVDALLFELTELLADFFLCDNESYIILVV